MRWRVYAGLAILAVAGSIAGVVFAITSVKGADDVARIKSALRLQTNCPHIAIRRPSRAAIVKRWAGSTVRTADVDCLSAGPQVIYDEFTDRAALAGAVAASPPSGGYCRLGQAIMLARHVGAASTVLADMCESLGGQLVVSS